MAIITGKNTDVLQRENGKVVISLRPIAERVAQRLDQVVPVDLSSVDTARLNTDFVLVDSKDLGRVQSGVKWFNRAHVRSPRRSRSRRSSGASLLDEGQATRGPASRAWRSTISMAVTLLAYRAGRSFYISSLPAEVTHPDAATAAFDIITRYVERGIETLLVLGVVLFVVAWLLGPSTGCDSPPRVVAAAARPRLGRAVRGRARPGRRVDRRPPQRIALRGRGAGRHHAAALGPPDRAGRDPAHLLTVFILAVISVLAGAAPKTTDGEKTADDQARGGSDGSVEARAAAFAERRDVREHVDDEAERDHEHPERADRAAASLHEAVEEGRPGQDEEAEDGDQAVLVGPGHPVGEQPQEHDPHPGPEQRCQHERTHAALLTPTAGRTSPQVDDRRSPRSPCGGDDAARPTADTQRMNTLAVDYPLLSLFWTMLWFFLFVVWIFAVFSVLADIFRSHDMGGWAKALWVLLVIIFPLLGVLIYLIARGDKMTQHAVRDAQKQDEYMRAYIQDAAGTNSPANQVAQLAQLRDQGVITDEQFESGQGQDPRLSRARRATVRRARLERARSSTR